MGIIDKAVKSNGNYTDSWFLCWQLQFDVARSFNVSREAGTKILLVSLRQEKGSKSITFDKKCWFGHYLISEAKYTIDTLMEDFVVLRFFIWAVPGVSSKAAILISHAIKRRMSCGPVAWKWNLNRPINTFLPFETIHYCQVFLDYMS